MSIPSKAPGGYGTLSNKGYRRIWIKSKRIYVYEHRLIYEAYFGKIPKNMQIHHINGDKLDNRIQNIKCIDQSTHNKITRNAILKSDGWYRPCSRCKKVIPESDFYRDRFGWIIGWCKPCLNTYNSEKRRIKNNKKKYEIAHPPTNK